MIAPFLVELDQAFELGLEIVRRFGPGLFAFLIEIVLLGFGGLRRLRGFALLFVLALLFFLHFGLGDSGFFEDGVLL